MPSTVVGLVLSHAAGEQSRGIFDNLRFANGFAMTIQTAQTEKILVLTMTNGPLNRLGSSGGHLRELLSALEAAALDPSCDIIVITGAGAVFSGGADVLGAGNETTPADLREAISLIEQAPKPVIMAINGPAFGGGLEFALAGHYRLARENALFRLHEVTLGVLPGAGATQRLPRLIGAGPALDLMLTGRTISAQEAARLGLVDEVVIGDVVAAAMAFQPAADLSGRVTASLPPPADLQEAVRDARASLVPSRSGSATAIIGSVARLTGDIATGLDHEAGEFARLLASDASRGLRHTFAAEQAADRIVGLAGDDVTQLGQRIGIVGGDSAGVAIATALLNAGHGVIVVERREEVLSQALAVIRESILGELNLTGLDRATIDKRLARLAGSMDYAKLAGVDLVIDATTSDPAPKRGSVQTIESHIASGAVLASTGLTASIEDLIDAVGDPSRLVGLHLAPASNGIGVVEVEPCVQTSPEAVSKVASLAKGLARFVVVTGGGCGPIGLRMCEQYVRQAALLLQEGGEPQQIDRALEEWGFAEGPCRMSDRNPRILESSPRVGRALQPDADCGSGGETDRATGQDEVNAESRNGDAHHAAQQKRLLDDEIVERCLRALVDEALRIVGRGTAVRPTDVDVICLHGLGMARDRGGPLFQAGEIGALTR